jgi:hypothetical protein
MEEMRFSAGIASQEAFLPISLAPEALSDVNSDISGQIFGSTPEGGGTMFMEGAAQISVIQAVPSENILGQANFMAPNGPGLLENSSEFPRFDGQNVFAKAPLDQVRDLLPSLGKGDLIRVIADAKWCLVNFHGEKFTTRGQIAVKGRRGPGRHHKPLGHMQKGHCTINGINLLPVITSMEKKILRTKKPMGKPLRVVNFSDESEASFRKSRMPKQSSAHTLVGGLATPLPARGDVSEILPSPNASPEVLGPFAEESKASGLPLLPRPSEPRVPRHGSRGFHVRQMTGDENCVGNPPENETLWTPEGGLVHIAPAPSAEFGWVDPRDVSPFSWDGHGDLETQFYDDLVPENGLDEMNAMPSFSLHCLSPRQESPSFPCLSPCQGSQQEREEGPEEGRGSLGLHDPPGFPMEMDEDLLWDGVFHVHAIDGVFDESPPQGAALEHGAGIDGGQGDPSPPSPESQVGGGGEGMMRLANRSKVPPYLMPPGVRMRISPKANKMKKLAWKVRLNWSPRPGH